VFGDALPAVVRYADWLAHVGVERGLLGPREVPRLWERHLLNCSVLADLVPGGASVADVGSGAGLPGIVVALQRPDLSVTLVEPLLRRATFLTQVVADLGLRRVDVVRARAEDLVGVVTVDVVVARAVAPLDRLAGWGLPLLCGDGVLLALKGERASAEIAAAEQSGVLRRFGVTEPEIVVRTVGGDPTRVVRLVRRHSKEAG